MPLERVTKHTHKLLLKYKNENYHTTMDATIRALLTKANQKVTHIFTDEEFEEHWKYLDKTKRENYNKVPYGGHRQ